MLRWLFHTLNADDPSMAIVKLKLAGTKLTTIMLSFDQVHRAASILGGPIFNHAGTALPISLSEIIKMRKSEKLNFQPRGTNQNDEALYKCESSDIMASVIENNINFTVIIVGVKVYVKVTVGKHSDCVPFPYISSNTSNPELIKTCVNNALIQLCKQAWADLDINIS